MKTENFFNKATEIEVLGAIFLDNKALSNIIDFLEPEDFYVDNHKLIYNAMLKLYSKNEPITAVTIYESLKTIAKECCSVTYISELIASSSSSSCIKNYASLVKEKSNNRKLLRDLKNSLNNLEEGSESYSSVVSSLQDSFVSFTSNNRKIESIDAIMNRYLTLLEKRSRGEIEDLNFKTGLKSLDKFIGGFERQNLVILAARPSMGKSLVSLSITLNMTFKNKLKVAFFNLEMGEVPTIERLLSNKSFVAMQSLKKGNLKDDEWKRLITSCNELSNSNLSLFNDIYSLKAIAAECKRLKFQKGLDVVFIDYLQLIELDKRKETRTLDVSYISRSLKLLAKELDITIVALSQLSRSPEARSNHRPMLGDLRESGAIEQDADLVMFLYRDEYYNPESEDKGSIEFIIGKHRNGEVGTVKMRWNAEYQKVSF